MPVNTLKRKQKIRYESTDNEIDIFVPRKNKNNQKKTKIRYISPIDDDSYDNDDYDKRDCINNENSENMSEESAPEPEVQPKTKTKKRRV